MGQVFDAVRFVEILQRTVEAVGEQGFEGLVAKKRSSRYESGKRSGAWQKMGVNRSQDFVIGGYTIGGNPFDGIVFGYYQSGRLMYRGTHLCRVHATSR
jgi:bifunctional non-homologous end joining protein LigD